jgi:hypothetical protein
MIWLLCTATRSRSTRMFMNWTEARIRVKLFMLSSPLDMTAEVAEPTLALFVDSRMQSARTARTPAKH